MTTSVRCWGERCKKPVCESPHHPRKVDHADSAYDDSGSDQTPEAGMEASDSVLASRLAGAPSHHPSDQKGILAIPSPESSFNELREHFKITNARLACLPHEDAIHACLTCLRQGENTCGKTGNPAGRNRFCSGECEAVFETLERKRPKITVAEVVAK